VRGLRDGHWPMTGRASRYPLLLTWLPPPLAVGIALWATRNVPAHGGLLAPTTSRIVGTAILLGGIVCLQGAVLGLRRVSLGRRSGQVAARWPYVAAVPVGLMMVGIWEIFFAWS
jgi:hypothetical protein